MPLKTTKLKIGGIKWILFARDHEGYPSGAQTLLMEYANSSLYMSFGAAAGYGNSNVRTSASDIYQGFSDKEKAATLLTERNYRQTSSYYSTNEYTFPLNSAEVGFENDANMGSNIGFNTATEKIYYISIS